MPDICRTNYVRLQNERPRSVRGCPLDKGKPDEWSRSISCTGTVFNINLGSTSKIHHVAVNAIGVDWQMHWEPVSLRVSLCTLRDSAVASAAWGGFCAHAQQYIPIPLSYPPSIPPLFPSSFFRFNPWFRVLVIMKSDKELVGTLTVRARCACAHIYCQELL